jgi:hypothetical protein
MKIFEKFPFLLGLLGSLFMLLSFMVKSPNSQYNQELAVMGAAAAIAYWLMMVWQVRADSRKQQVRNLRWLVITVALPFVGALLYQIMYQRYLPEVEQEATAANEIAA